MPSLKLNDTIDMKKHIDSSSKEINTKHEPFGINTKTETKTIAQLKTMENGMK